MRRLAFGFCLFQLSIATPSRAQETTSAAAEPKQGDREPAPSTNTAAAAAPIQPPKAPQREVSLEPKPAEPKPAGRATLNVDPIADTAVIAVALGFAGVLELINSTGEIRPQQISPSFRRSQLIGIDRGAITATPEKSAGPISNAGLGLAAVFAIIDPVISGFRENSVQTGLVDGFLYAQTVSLTLAMTNMTKMAVRRPRPLAYIDAEAHRGDPDYSNSSTDSTLSFFSGHAATTAAIGATATYLAFTRSPHTARPWITLGISTLVTTVVSIERVRAGKHFPTDVIAGSVAGAGIGVIVPHLHRSEDVEQRRVWVGFTPSTTESIARGGVLQVAGAF
jgi:membrane-associated phospholipid phosphatase